jgi:hypothetical protein
VRVVLSSAGHDWLGKLPPKACRGCLALVGNGLSAKTLLQLLADCVQEAVRMLLKL